ncbi:hypothetical protein AB0J72_56120 [Dactylosporangium sp. NPDC049742]|uniref:hypothetical protein n=1 Tax=Dactylosporangium sp. NPDC049742 TaxID=3154737 RepID=UPI0034497551
MFVAPWAIAAPGCIRATLEPRRAARHRAAGPADRPGAGHPGVDGRRPHRPGDAEPIGVSVTTVGTHVRAVFHTVDPPDGVADNRQVPAVLTYLDRR